MNDGIQRFKSLLNILRNYQEIVRQECMVHQWTTLDVRFFTSWNINDNYMYILTDSNIYEVKSPG